MELRKAGLGAAAQDKEKKAALAGAEVAQYAKKVQAGEVVG